MEEDIFMQNTVKKQFTQFELSKLIISTKFLSKNKLSPSARLVLIVLTSHYPNIYPSLKTIQEESGIASKTSVISSLKELSKAGFIFYETKNVNHYKFTQYFFESLDIEHQWYENCKESGTKIEHKQIKKQKNNKFLNKNNEKTYNNAYNHQLTGINYPKYAKPKDLQKQSPLDMNKNQAIEFLKNLPENLQNSYFAIELKKKWIL